MSLVIADSGSDGQTNPKDFFYYKERDTFRAIMFKSRGGNSIDISRIIMIGWKSLKDFKSLGGKMN